MEDERETKPEEKTSTLRLLPDFNWSGDENTFEWVLRTAARMRVEAELGRIREKSKRR